MTNASTSQQFTRASIIPWADPKADGHPRSTSVHSLLSIELGRMPLSSKMALKVARATGVGLDWLRDGTGGPINDRGELYSRQDFDDSQDRDQTMEFYLPSEEMETLVAADLLLRVHKEVRARAFHAFPQFPRTSDAFQGFIEDQAKKLPQLKELRPGLSRRTRRATNAEATAGLIFSRPPWNPSSGFARSATKRSQRTAIGKNGRHHGLSA